MSKDREKQTQDAPRVRTVILLDQTKDEIFGINAWRMSKRAFEYDGLEGEQLASFQAPVLERYLNILEGIDVKLTVFDLNNQHNKFYIGFPSTCTNVDTAVGMANRYLKEQGIEELPIPPQLL